MPRGRTKAPRNPRPAAIPDQGAGGDAVPHRVPSYRLHRPSGHAVVTLAGHDHYLGPYGTPASRTEYKRLLAEWFAGGCPTQPIAERPDLLVSEVILAYWRHVEATYDERTRDGTIAPVLRRLRKLYGHTRVADFGPLALKGFRTSLLGEQEGPRGRLSRSYVNRAIQWVRRVFKWAASEELVPASIPHALATVEPLRRGRTDAPECEPVRAVPDAVVEATLACLPPVVADMVRLQRLTGMRPGEVCAITTGQLDTSGPVWLYRPTHHKNLHRGLDRVVPIGPRAQQVLGPYLRHELDAPVFSPALSEARRKVEMAAKNRTPMTPSRRRRDEARAKSPKRKLADRYDTTTYGIAVRRAAEAAGVGAWSPNQLRHARATELRRELGLDAAGAVLGHARLETTQIYAERSQRLAVEAARASG